MTRVSGRPFAATSWTSGQAFAASLEGSRAETFSRIKIEGIVESSLGIAVTYDPERGAPAVLGRHTISDTGLYSTCLAIQNLWLAATEEGLGVGWVSFYREDFLRELLSIPARLRPVAWLCLGPVTHLEPVPDLERDGWRQRRPLAHAIHYEGYETARYDGLRSAGQGPRQRARERRSALCRRPQEHCPGAVVGCLRWGCNSS